MVSLIMGSLTKKMSICLIAALVAMCGFVTSTWAQFVVEEGLISYWTFDKDTVTENRVKDIFGGQDADIVGTVDFVRGTLGDALKLEGGSGNYLLITDDINTAELPQHELTAEAWVLTELFIEWGSFIGAFQDNGGFEKGWTLGMNNQTSFAVSTLKARNIDGDGVMTYLTAGALNTGQWHHIAGTYDGELMRVYIDGDLKAETTLQSGDINYPPNLFFTIGSYKDDNEDFSHTGLIDEVRLYDRALTIGEVENNFNAREGLAVRPAGKLGVTWGTIKTAAF